jgi:hypothetical protein
MHEHLRKREEAMNQLLTLTVTGATTLLAALAAFVFQFATTNPDKLTVTLCYLLLAPIPFLFFALAMLSSQRDDIFKIGYYIKVFFELGIGGAMWGVSLDRLRQDVRGESQDPAAFALWAIFLISSALFCVSLTFLKGWAVAHALIVAPLLFAMLFEHRRFMKDRSYMERAWIAVKEQQSATGAKTVPAPSIVMEAKPLASN